VSTMQASEQSASAFIADELSLFYKYTFGSQIAIIKPRAEAEMMSDGGLYPDFDVSITPQSSLQMS
jgi:hypothetical protein